MSAGSTGRWRRSLINYCKEKDIDINQPEEKLVEIRQKTINWKCGTPTVKETLELLKMVR